MIGETGRNLSVLITTESGKDWETFETWYSVFKNLPEAQVAIACQRAQETPFQLFQWARRLKLNLFFHSPFDKNDLIVNRLDAIYKALQRKMVGDNILIITPLVLSISVLERKAAKEMQERHTWINEQAWFLHKPDIATMMDQRVLNGHELPHDTTPLCIEAKETENLHWLVSHRKGCGKWIDTLRGCPFSSAAGLATTTMTVNENRIIELWKKMCALYSALA